MSTVAEPEPSSGLPSTAPRVLTRNSIPELTEGLDASDVLECYTLVRDSPLHGIANSTIHIKKMALGLRFRPSASIGTHNKRPLELTLEYGPQRLGENIDHEAIPFIQVDGSASFVSWENVGKIYYTTKIDTLQYTSAYFMASMTGAVLNKILFEALDYTLKRRRYQPFSIYSAENGKELRSSSSTDFTHYMWNHLANLGVEIEPILKPPIYEARLWVNDITKVLPDPGVSQAAATFYQKLYQCLEAIATADYSAYQLTSVPSTLPSAAPSPFGGAPVNGPSDDGDDDSSSTLRQHVDDDDGGGNINKVPEGDSDRGSRILNDSIDDSSRRDRRDDDLVEGNEAAEDSMAPSSGSFPTSSPAPTDFASESGDTEEYDVDKANHAAEEAKQAAQEAQEAAKTEGDTKAADAAQAAANAAQKAADATSNAASQSARDSILSGDGSSMSLVVNTCFTNPKYEMIFIDENGTTMPPQAYLYLDGSQFYKLNMTAPYLEIARVENILPKPVDSGNLVGGGDMVDWTLACLVLGSVLLGFLIILQQAGRYIYCLPLYKCQKWLFEPRKENHDEDLEQRLPFTFGVDAIPLSMGGIMTNSSPVQKTRKNGRSSPEPLDFANHQLPQNGKTRIILRAGSRDGEEDLGEVEMNDLGTLNGPKAPRRKNSTGSHSSLDDLDPHDNVPVRLMRDPELVDMPHLKSRSKVAVPHGYNNRSSSSIGD
jgi:hypothetical protein